MIIAELPYVSDFFKETIIENNFSTIKTENAGQIFDGLIQPIEVNPLRFGGFCTTADCTWFTYGVNSYAYFFNEQKPDWKNIFKTRKDKLYSLLVLNNSTGVSGTNITNFDYDKIAGCLEKPLEVRAVDYTEFPLFGFVFAETRAENYAELEYLLQSDLREFINTST